VNLVKKIKAFRTKADLLPLFLFVAFIVSAILIEYFQSQDRYVFNSFYLFSPLLFSCLILCLYFLSKRYISPKILAYLLFFTVAITTMAGYTEPLTGKYNDSSSSLLFGLSFFTAYFAYHIFTKKINNTSIWVASNPLLLVTGPIATKFKSQAHKRLLDRASYYLPFFLVGIFFFKIIAAPLTSFFWMLDLTNSIEVITFGLIFELFIYFNFCGLSLIVFSIFGIFGVRIPLNFKQPFSSENIIDYWKNWHISLSTVLKTLFYSPTRKNYPTSLALFIVFISSAMWHGVTVNFAMWGIFHALMFIITIKLLSKEYKILSTFLMIFAIIIGMVIFADSETDRLIMKLTPSFEAMGTTLSLFINSSNHSLISLVLALFLVGIEFLLRKRKHFRERTYKFLRLPVTQLILASLFVLLAIDSIGMNYPVYGQR